MCRKKNKIKRKRKNVIKVQLPWYILYIHNIIEALHTYDRNYNVKQKDVDKDHMGKIKKDLGSPIK